MDPQNSNPSQTNWKELTQAQLLYQGAEAVCVGFNQFFSALKI
jgi:hypothetical protein